MLDLYQSLGRRLNFTGAYVVIMLVCRRLLTTRLPGKAAV